MPQNKVKYHEKNVYDFQLEKTVDMRILMKKLGPALEKGQKKSVELDVIEHRSVLLERYSVQRLQRSTASHSG